MSRLFQLFQGIHTVHGRTCAPQCVPCSLFGSHPLVISSRRSSLNSWDRHTNQIAIRSGVETQSGVLNRPFLGFGLDVAVVPDLNCQQASWLGNAHRGPPRLSGIGRAIGINLKYVRAGLSMRGPVVRPKIRVSAHQSAPSYGALRSFYVGRH